MNKEKIYLILLGLSSFLGYLKWGGNQETFIFTLEWDLIRNFTHRPSDFLHPFILFPLVGQVLIVILIFQKHPSRKIIYLAIGCLSLLYLFLLFIGVMSLSLEITLGSLPFVLISILLILSIKKSNYGSKKSLD